MYDDPYPLQFKFTRPRRCRRKPRGAGRRVSVPRKPVMALPDTKPGRAQWVTERLDAMRLGGWTYCAIAWRMGTTIEALRTYRRALVLAPRLFCYFLETLKGRKPPRKRKCK